MIGPVVFAGIALGLPCRRFPRPSPPRASLFSLFTSHLLSAYASESSPLPLPPPFVALLSADASESSPLPLPPPSSPSASSSPPSPSPFPIFLFVSHLRRYLPPLPSSSYRVVVSPSPFPICHLPFRSSSSFHISSLDLPCFQCLADSRCIHRLLQLRLAANDSPPTAGVFIWFILSSVVVPIFLLQSYTRDSVDFACSIFSPPFDWSNPSSLSFDFPPLSPRTLALCFVDFPPLFVSPPPPLVSTEISLSLPFLVFAATSHVSAPRLPFTACCCQEVANPVHLTVDTGFRNGEASIKAYVSVNLSLGDQQLAAQFKEIPLYLMMVEAKRVGSPAKTNEEARHRKMVSPKVLLSTIEMALLGASPPTPQQRIELMHAIRSSLPSLRNLLSYPTPKPSDWSQVQSKEVRLPDSPPISLDDQDVQIALKLSDDLNLNEVDCVGLIISANQEAVVLDQGLEADLVADIQNHLEDLFSSGLRQRLIMLIKELNREEPAGLGGPHAERYVLDSRGALVEWRAVVSRERLSLSHCLVLSVLTLRMTLNAYIVVLSVGSKDTKDVFALLKDCAAEVNDSGDILKLQIAFSLLFSLVIAFLQVAATGNDQNVEGFVNIVRFSWTVHLMLTQEAKTVRETLSGASSSDLANIHSYLEFVSSENIFQFLLDKVLRTAAYQNDDEDMIYMYNAYLHKSMTCFLAHPLARDKASQLNNVLVELVQPALLCIINGEQFHFVNLHSIPIYTENAGS
ncbi:hypothetical protein ACLOJK_036228 [Asimina triloba]